MFFYGWYATELSEKRPKDTSCYKCNTEGGLVIRRFVRVFHIFYVPIIPYGFESEIVCHNCSQHLEFDTLKTEKGGNVRGYLYRIPPIWSFAGPLLILAFIIFNMYSNNSQKTYMLEQVEHMERGRLVEFQRENAMFSTFKVCDVQPDNLRVLYNKFEVADKTQLSTIEYPNNYTVDTFDLKINALREWVSDDRVISIYWPQE